MRPVADTSRSEAHRDDRGVPTLSASKAGRRRDRSIWTASDESRAVVDSTNGEIRVVEGARLEIALTVCDGVLQISITVAESAR